MSRPGLKILRIWVGPAVLLAAAPKCTLCLLAYAGLGAALGLSGPELCGAAGRTAALPMVLGAAGAGGFLLHRMMRRSHPSRP